MCFLFLFLLKMIIYSIIKIGKRKEFTVKDGSFLCTNEVVAKMSSLQPYFLETLEKRSHPKHSMSPEKIRQKTVLMKKKQKLVMQG